MIKGKFFWYGTFSSSPLNTHRHISLVSISLDSVWLASLGWRAETEQTNYYHCTYQAVGNMDVPFYNMNTKQPYPPSSTLKTTHMSLKPREGDQFSFKPYFQFCACVCLCGHAHECRGKKTKGACSHPEEQDSRIFQCPGEDLSPHWKPDVMSEMRSQPSNNLKSKAERRGARSEHVSS